MTAFGRLGTGFYFDDLAVGSTWQSAGRTIVEADLAAYVNLTWFTEELFTNQQQTADNVIAGRPVPGSMVFAMAEGLIIASMARTGLAFLGMDLDIKRPTRVGDTIHVDCEVIEARPTSTPGRGLVRTRNVVRNAADEEVLVYRPLRLIRARPA